jgi:ubiquinone/menaquinone biosynthesis C-methylase UbiE
MDDKTIKLLIDLHLNNKRQGPGSDRAFRRALELAEVDTQSELKIADIGCGTGVSSIALAKHTKSKITAVDIFKDFLDKLNDRAQTAKVSGQINTFQADMSDLPFEKEQFDVIWAEGAIYNIGFENGIKKWRKFLKPGGRLVLTEITWLQEAIPKDLNEHWAEEYPEIDFASSKISHLEKNGYMPIAYFPLTQEVWIDNYYSPLEASFESFLKRNNHSQEAQVIVEAEKKEIALYNKYKDYYSYGCYIAVKL